MDEISTPNSLPNTHMKYLKNPLITIPAIVVISGLLLSLVNGSASAKKDYSEQAKQVIENIIAEQTNYSLAEAAEVQAKATLDAAALQKFNAATRARGERFKLCTLHHLKVNSAGEAQEATDAECASFQ